MGIFYMLLLAVVVELLSRKFIKRDFKDNKNQYLIYFKKDYYHDLSQDERFQDLGKWTRYKHETLKLITVCKREEINNKIKNILGLSDSDFKVVGVRDVYAPGFRGGRF